MINNKQDLNDILSQNAVPIKMFYLNSLLFFTKMPKNTPFNHKKCLKLKE